MKKKSYPEYPPPIALLADYYHPPNKSKKMLSKKSLAHSDAKIPQSYPPPISSLADFYHANSVPTNLIDPLPAKSKTSKKIIRDSKSKKSKKTKNG